MCRVCHQPGGTAELKLNFNMHNTPNYAADDVDCGSCHEVHRINAGSANTTESTNPVTSSTAENLKFVRANVNKYISTATSGEAVYHTAGDDRAIEGGDSTTARGICQSCHSETSYHKHGGGTDASQCHVGGTNDTCPAAETDCSICHSHTDNFLPTGGSCTGCHNTTQDNGNYTGRRAVVPEFARLSTHVADTSLADSDCEVCHAQEPPDNSHEHGLSGGTADNRVTLWNVDATDPQTSIQLAVDGDPALDRAEAVLLTPFCLDCHDSDGALTQGANALAPFTGSIAPADIAASWSSSSHGTIAQTANGSSQITTCYGDGSFGCHASGHGSEKQPLLTPDTHILATSPDLSEQREGFCLNCHVSGGESSIDIDQYFGGAATNIREAAGLQYATVNQRHDVLPADQSSWSGAVMTCKDCHSPHKDNNSAPVANPDTGAALAVYDKTNSYSGDATGFAYAWNASDYDPTFPEGGTDIPETDYVEFCLVCHDGTAPPGVTLPAEPAAGMLNMADMYRANDQHGRLEGGGSASRGYMKMPWANSTNYDAGDQPSQVYAALNCTLCHGCPRFRKYL